MNDSFTSSWMRRGNIRSRLLGAVIWLFFGLQWWEKTTLKYTIFEGFSQQKCEPLTRCRYTSYGGPAGAAEPHWPIASDKPFRLCRRRRDQPLELHRRKRIGDVVSLAQ